MAPPDRSPWGDEDQAHHHRQDHQPPDDGNGRGGCFWAGVFLAGIVALVIILIVAFPQARGGDFDWLRLTYLLVLLMFLVVSVGGAFRANAGQTVRYAAIWMGIAAAIALLFTFRQEFGFIKDRVVANIAPSHGVESPDGRSISFQAFEDGHYYVEAAVDGVPILFMVDTGASQVVLTRYDADRLGLDPATLNYSQRVSTANGTVLVAPLTLSSIAVGPIEVRNVRASVNQADMGISLLGMSFLRELGGFEFTNDQLTLRQ